MSCLSPSASNRPKIRTLIVDDEPLARDKVRMLLQRDPEFDIIGECVDGTEAIEAIKKHTPDLVFLDIQMPGADGFEVLLSVGIDRIPAIVFVTAYDQHALRAFEYHAIDYLLKPFAAQRFQETLTRAKSQIFTNGNGQYKQQLLSMLGQVKGGSPFVDRLVVKSSGRVVFLNVGEIDWIEAAGNYASLHTGTASHLIRGTMNDLESQLDPRSFARIHRSTIVRTECIKELQSLCHGDYSLILKDGTRLTMSRNFRDRLPKGMG